MNPQEHKQYEEWIPGTTQLSTMHPEQKRITIITPPGKKSEAEWTHMNTINKKNELSGTH